MVTGTDKIDRVLTHKLWGTLIFVLLMLMVFTSVFGTSPTLLLKRRRKWKFKPAQSGGHAVASVWTLRYTFRRSGPEVTAVEVSP